MGDEVLEEAEFEPMFADVEGALGGKKVALFGSYGWGDGQWMRDWVERCRNAGATTVLLLTTLRFAPSKRQEAFLFGLINCVNDHDPAGRKSDRRRSQREPGVHDRGIPSRPEGAGQLRLRRDRGRGGRDRDLGQQRDGQRPLRPRREDEKIPAGKTAMEKLDKLPEHCSHLFMAIGGRLAAVICIEDSIRAEAPAVVEELRSLGISKIVMMTGDSRRTAAAVAKLVGVDEYKAEVLPEDKASFIREQHEAGRKVIMVGDGVNDSPALSEADAGIAISEGAAIAREIADITISEEELSSLVTLRRIASGLSERTQQNYRTIMSFNTGLILLGVAGIFAPQTAALLHNLSTLAIGMHSMTDLLPAMGG